MTVVTKPLSQQEKEQKGEDKDDMATEEVSLSVGEKLTETRITVIGLPNRPNQTKSSHMCLVVTVMLTMALALSLLGYYQLKHQHRHAAYRGMCHVPCPRRSAKLCQRMRGGRQHQDRPSEPVLVVGNFGGYPGAEAPLISREFEIDESMEVVSEAIFENGTIEIDYQLDLEEETFEVIQMPEISNGIYIHDFTFNKTAIMEMSRCFVMDLDRNEISPPRSFLDIITKMKDGYELDLNEIQHDMRVTAVLTDGDLNGYGMIISNFCKERTTYKLETIVMDDVFAYTEVEVDVAVDSNGRISKRSDESPESLTFTEISNVIVTYKIANLHEF